MNNLPSVVPNSAIIWMAVTALLATIVPIAILIVWRMKTKSKIVPALIGAAIFVLFALMLESIPKAFLFMGNNPVSVYVLNHPWAFTLAGCALAGIFEETGRYVAFRSVLKNHKSKETSVTYGIGHGGIESIIILGVNLVSYIGMAVMINQGAFDTVLASVPAEQANALAAVMNSITQYSALSSFMGIGERLIAITLHISLSVFVFIAVREKGKGFVFPLAIVLHMLFDVPAALYQYGVLNIYVCELTLLAFVVVVARVAYKLYKNMKPDMEEEIVEEAEVTV